MSIQDCEEDMQERIKALKKYDFDFENLVLCGGGIKTMSFIGGIMVLDEVGVLQKCKRFAATSAGSLIATFLSLDVSIPTIKKFFYTGLKEKVFDHSVLSLVPNVVQRYGWCPSDKLQRFIEDTIEEQTGNSKITFLQAYKRYKKELCVVVTNVSTMSVEYFHHKTTPDVPIVVAVRSSGALPGIIQPVFFEEQAQVSQYFVDGGLTANFPLHAFDGWYFSLAPEDSYFNKLGEDEPPFETFNPQTLGFLLYGPAEAEFARRELHNRQKGEKLRRPTTQLSKSKQEYCDTILRENARRHELVEASKTFMNALKELEENDSSGIPFTEFKKAFDNLQDNEDIKLLFGDKFHIEDIFAYLDKDTDGKVTFHEFLIYMQAKGANIQVLLEGGFTNNIQTFSQFYGSILTTILSMTQKLYVKELDSHRTVGVYRDYVDVIDFGLVDADRDFLMRQGIVGTLVYFEEMIKKYKNGTLPKAMARSVKPHPMNITRCMLSLMSTLGSSLSLNCEDSTKDFNWGCYSNVPNAQDDEGSY